MHSGKRHYQPLPKKDSHSHHASHLVKTVVHRQCCYSSSIYYWLEATAHSMFVKQLNNNYNQQNTMKNLILSAAVLLTISFTAAATTVEPVVNEKAQKTLTNVFKDADGVKWSRPDSNYEAYFENKGIKTRATIDDEGNLLQTIRYYDENNLPACILYQIKKGYKGKEVHGVTEVTHKNGVNYRIVLKDNKYYTQINANATGETELVSKCTRGDK